MRIPHYNGIILFGSHECKCFRSLNRYDDEELSAINRKQNICHQKRFQFSFLQTHDVAQIKQNSPADHLPSRSLDFNI